MAERLSWTCLKLNFLIYFHFLSLGCREDWTSLVTLVPWRLKEILSKCSVMSVCTTFHPHQNLQEEFEDDGERTNQKENVLPMGCMFTQANTSYDNNYVGENESNCTWCLKIKSMRVQWMFFSFSDRFLTQTKWLSCQTGSETVFYQSYIRYSNPGFKILKKNWRSFRSFEPGSCFCVLGDTSGVVFLACFCPSVPVFILYEILPECKQRTWWKETTTSHVF